MKNAYPILMNANDGQIVVYVPDFEINTEGDSYADAMEMARDAIGLVGITLEDEGRPLPSPRAMEEVDAEDGMVTLVDVDFTEYRRRHDMTCVRKNCTIPSWLNAEAERAGLNFSAVLQKGLKRELHLAES